MGDCNHLCELSGSVSCIVFQFKQEDHQMASLEWFDGIQLWGASSCDPHCHKLDLDSSFPMGNSCGRWVTESGVSEDDCEEALSAPSIEVQSGAC